MCKGAAMEESKYRGGLCRPSPRAASTVSCELCAARATLYCQADDAYLCGKCDQWVHGANFLAKRHVRCVLCNTCQRLTQRYCVGVSSEVATLPSLVRSAERSQCDSAAAEESPRTLKRPFLLI